MGSMGKHSSEPMADIVLSFHFPAQWRLLPNGTESSEHMTHGPRNFSSLLPPTGWLTAGQGLKALRLAGRDPQISLSNPKLHALFAPPDSLVHLGNTSRLGCLLPQEAQTEGPVLQLGTCRAHKQQSSLQSVAPSTGTQKAPKVKAAQKQTTDP